MATRREFLKSIGMGTAFIASGGLARASSDKRPNIVLMMADDMGYECLSCNGGLSYKTPIFDALADKGLRFQHCYSQPVCTPSRVKIMTGQYNARNYVAFGTLKHGERTFGHLMQEAGYATCIAGKWQLSGAYGFKGTLPEEAGFDEYCLWQIDSDDKGSRYWNPKLIENGKVVEGAEGKYGPDILSGFVNGFSEKNKDKPFFAYYPMVLTHGPHVPTPDSAEGDKSSKRDPTKYFPDMIAYAEKIVASVVDNLERLGLLENTLVIFIADNGTDKKITSKFGDRLIRGGKGTTPDAGTHVPMIAYWKGVTPTGKVCNSLVDFADFLPTFLEIAGASVPGYVDGKSFLYLLRGDLDKTKDWVFCHYEKGKHAAEEAGKKEVSTEKQERIKNKPPYTRFARNQRYKLYDNGNFFDIPADPEEKSPIKAAPEVCDRLQAVLDSVK